jgi:excisionase family DNA binding protein
MALRLDDAARAMGVSVSLIKRQVAKGIIPSTKLGNTRLIPIEGLRKLLGANS